MKNVLVVVFILFALPVAAQNTHDCYYECSAACSAAIHERDAPVSRCSNHPGVPGVTSGTAGMCSNDYGLKLDPARNDMVCTSTGCTISGKLRCFNYNNNPPTPTRPSFNLSCGTTNGALPLVDTGDNFAQCMNGYGTIVAVECASDGTAVTTIQY